MGPPGGAGSYGQPSPGPGPYGAPGHHQAFGQNQAPSPPTGSPPRADRVGWASLTDTTSPPHGQYGHPPGPPGSYGPPPALPSMGPGPRGWAGTAAPPLAQQWAVPQRLVGPDPSTGTKGELWNGRLQVWHWKRWCAFETNHLMPWVYQVRPLKPRMILKWLACPMRS
jgi:hypothetical protein